MKTLEYKPREFGCKGDFLNFKVKDLYHNCAP